MSASPTSPPPPLAPPEGMPCWVDAVFPDHEGAKSFYGELLGWTYAEPQSEYVGYTQALVDGRAVAAVVPSMPGQDDPPIAWNLYFSTPDVEATAARVREHGGTVSMEPIQVGPFGSMLVAQDPGGVWFSAWQAASHTGFGLPPGTPGAFCWAEVTTRDADATDAFFAAVFGFEVRRMDSSEVDYAVYTVPGSQSGPALGRLRTDDRTPSEVPPHINTHFAVSDLGPALETVSRRGGTTLSGPHDSPFGRFATVRDPWGTVFTLIDTTRTVGEMPSFG